MDRGLAGLGNMIFAFTSSEIFGLVPTENPDTPYRVSKYSATVGAVSHQSIVEAEDENGNPCLYFLDPALGPYRLGRDGLKWVGKDVFDLWSGFGAYQSAKVPAMGLYYKDRRQVWFWWTPDTSGDDPTSDAASWPSVMMVLQVNEQRPDEYGDVRGGWSRWTSPSGNDGLAHSSAATMHPFRNTASGNAFKRYQRPLVSSIAQTELRQVPALLTESETRDDGRTIQAYLTSRAMRMDDPVFHLGVQRSWITCDSSTAIGNATIQQTLTRNYGEETRTATVTVTASASQSRALKVFEDAALQDAYAVQVTLGDSAASSQCWSIDSWHAEVNPNQVV